MQEHHQYCCGSKKRVEQLACKLIEGSSLARFEVFGKFGGPLVVAVSPLEAGSFLGDDLALSRSNRGLN